MTMRINCRPFRKERRKFKYVLTNRGRRELNLFTSIRDEFKYLLEAPREDKDFLEKTYKLLESVIDDIAFSGKKESEAFKELVDSYEEKTDLGLAPEEVKEPLIEEYIAPPEVFEMKEGQTQKIQPISVDQMTFHVTANEKELLSKITNVFKQHGFVALWNQAGKMTFFMDGTQSPYQICSQIEKVVNKEVTSHLEESSGYQNRVKVARELLDKYGFPESLKGTQYLFKILVRLSYQPHLLHSMGKGVYAELTDIHSCNFKIIDRTIRYAVDRSTLQGRNSRIVQSLFHEYIDILGLNLC